METDNYKKPGYMNWSLATRGDNVEDTESAKQIEDNLTTKLSKQYQSAHIYVFTLVFFTSVHCVVFAVHSFFKNNPARLLQWLNSFVLFLWAANTALQITHAL